MDFVFAALALVSGVIGAGFASGREILRFFAGHGAMAFAAVACALLTLSLLFVRLCAQLRETGCESVNALCSLRFGRRLGALCSLLFLTLCAVTGGAMLSACAELGALTLPIRHAYGLTAALSLLLALACARRGVPALALPGALLACLLPALFLRLLCLDGGEACFLPAMTPDLPVRATAEGVCYGALNAAMLAGAMPALLPLDRRALRRAVLLFSLIFGALLLLGVLVCRKHMAAIYMQPLPFVYLSRGLGKGGYLLVSACMYAAAFSTLCAMLLAAARLMPMRSGKGLLAAALLSLLFARIGFGALVSSAYPVLGALCAALLFVLCAPGCQKAGPPSIRESPTMK